MEDLENEIWKDVVGWEGRYSVSSKGRIKSLPRTSFRIQGNIPVKGGIVKPWISTTGYYTVCLSNREIKLKPKMRVHRLVALAFLENPEEKKYINHIDANKLNNNLENLEFCTHQENMQHARRLGLIDTEKSTAKISKPVTQFYLNGDFKEDHRSIIDAQRTTGIVSTSIKRFIAGGRFEKGINGNKIWSKCSHAGGFLWKYKEAN